MTRILLALALTLSGCGVRHEYPKVGAPPLSSGKCVNDHYENVGGQCSLKN